MAQQSTAMNAVVRNMQTNQQAIHRAQSALSQGLRQSDPQNLEEAHDVYNLANLLAHAIDFQVMTPNQARILGIKFKNANGKNPEDDNPDPNPGEY